MSATGGAIRAASAGIDRLPLSTPLGQLSRVRRAQHHLERPLLLFQVSEAFTNLLDGNLTQGLGQIFDRHGAPPSGDRDVTNDMGGGEKWDNSLSHGFFLRWPISGGA